ncbi:MAG: alanine racemase [Gammaproteobacteria bacterium]|nr:alanine racemase [Gammaproteobacteria bacterium]
MARPTRIEIDRVALRHNVKRVKACAPGKQVIAMVKADAYGCGVPAVVPALDSEVDAFGVACFEEARQVRRYTNKPCILFQGVFTPDELSSLVEENVEVVVHQKEQLQWILDAALDKPIRVWIKVDTGMHRLGFMPDEVPEVVTALKALPWVQDNIGIITHFASADTPDSPQNNVQLKAFNHLHLPEGIFTKSLGNSAAILSCPEVLSDAIRPGIMLYGVSPFFEQDGSSIELKPVMQFVSALTAVHTYLPGERVGYGAIWEAKRPSRIGVVAVGYGDGYPRHIKPSTPVYIEGQYVPIVGRISMDMLTVDLTDHQDIKLGSRVELWGSNLPVEQIARLAGTIGYELICQVSPRVRAQAVILNEDE